VPVELRVDDIVDEIGGAARQAKTHEHHRGRGRTLWVEHLSREDQAGENEGVLDPLPRAHPAHDQRRAAGAQHAGLDIHLGRGTARIGH
jgi:hypothetical protein